MFIPDRLRTAIAEKPEERSGPAVHIPMVYEKLAPEAWEYHVLAIDTREAPLPDAAQLNELGRNGWILAGTLDERTIERGGLVCFYFMRQARA